MAPHPFIGGGEKQGVCQAIPRTRDLSIQADRPRLDSEEGLRSLTALAD